MRASQSPTLRRCTFAFLAILLAVRVLWVPAHLASEPHGDVTHHAPHAPHAHHAHPHEHGEHDHAPEHDSHDDHPPHSAADHLTEFTSSRVDFDTAAVFVPVYIGISIADAPLATPRVAARAAESVPKSAPPRPSLARAPPIA